LYLIDTNVLAERRKGSRADAGVVGFLDDTRNELHVPVQVIGDLQSGIDGLKLRGVVPQALALQRWLNRILEHYSERIISFDLTCALAWGTLMWINDQNAVDRQIAAMALVYDLTIVTRNTSHFTGTGARILNPFLADAQPAKPTA
jgi:predicted nucleic acid-binding protein